MITFKEANKVRTLLKIPLSHYGWYIGSMITSTFDGYSIIIRVSHLDNAVRKIISPVVSGVSVKVEVE